MTDEHIQSQQAPAGDTGSVTAWLDDDADPELLRQLLYGVIDPELGVNIVDLGLVYDVAVTERVAKVQMTMTTPGCPLGAYFDDAVHSNLWGAPGVDDVDLQIVWEPPWNPEMMSDTAKDQLGWRR